MGKLEILNLNQSFPKDDGSRLVVLDNITFDVKDKEFVCILGSSGCGKTTLLNIIGKLLAPDSGDLIGFDGKAVSYIFQDPRLLPWKTVEENIRFVLRKSLSEKEQQRKVNQLISLVELNGFAGYYPSKLSGGMRQRVSIARAFAFPSDIILMDEPLKGLDIKLKLNLIRTISMVWQADKRTVIFVTHDVDEALLLGNEIVVLSQAPVKILTHEKVEAPVMNRSLDSDYLKELKKRLMTALDN